MFSYIPDPVVPLTVFAPPNEAFQKLPKDIMEKIKTNLTFNGSKNHFYFFFVNTKGFSFMQIFFKYLAKSYLV